MSDKATQYKNELKTLSESLPFKKVECEEFDNPDFQPEIIRQERSLAGFDNTMQPISRFLVERGVVEILPNEKMFELFKEIHWNAAQIRKMALTEETKEKPLREIVMQARRLISGIESAEEELFIANRRLVVSCVKPFFWVGQVWIGDFLQEGARALSNAIRKFDFTRGTPFYAYAHKAIQNRLRNYFRDHVRSGSIGIRPSRDMIVIKKVIDEWQEENEEEPTVAVISGLTGIPEEQISKIRPFIKHWEKMPSPPVSLDALMGDSETSLYTFVENTEGEQASASAQKAEIWETIDKLPARAKYIMRLRYIEGRTLEETGQILNLTRARIKQIQDESLRKLRQMLRRGIDDPNM